MKRRIGYQKDSLFFCGERGIRTPGGVTLNGFQDRRIRPLCHFSLTKCIVTNTGAKVQLFSYSANKKHIFFQKKIYFADYHCFMFFIVK